MSSQRVRLELRERFALLRLALPRGLVDARALEELESTCSELATSLDLRALIVTGWQGVFACGWSPGLLADARAGAGSLSQAFSPLARLPVPVICAINGDAISAGLELALACDIRLAAEEARFALPEVQQGRLPMGGGSQRLSRTVGRGKAAWLLLTGEAIDATEALRMGLVNAVHSSEALLPEAEALAEKIARQAPLAIRYAKEAMLQGIEMPLEQALLYELDLAVILQTTRDRAEGVRAFLEKHEPEFRGE